MLQKGAWRGECEGRRAAELQGWARTALVLQNGGMDFILKNQRSHAAELIYRKLLTCVVMTNGPLHAIGCFRRLPANTMKQAPLQHE
jgi:hypothetical protein